MVQNCSLQADIKCAKQCYSKDRYMLYINWRGTWIYESHLNSNELLIFGDWILLPNCSVFAHEIWGEFVMIKNCLFFHVPLQFTFSNIMENYSITVVRVQENGTLVWQLGSC